MSGFITPITDRDQADIDALNSKAYLNVADLNRISGNAKTANTLVALLTDSAIPFDIVTEPTMSLDPRELVAWLNTTLANIERVRLAACLPAIPGLVEITSAWVAGANQDAPDFEDANTWERVTGLIASSMRRVADWHISCGIATCGMPQMWQNRWMQYGWVQPAVTPQRYFRSGIASSGTGLTRGNNWRTY